MLLFSPQMDLSHRFSKEEVRVWPHCGGTGGAAGPWGRGSAPGDAPQGQPVVGGQGWVQGVAGPGTELGEL